MFPRRKEHEIVDSLRVARYIQQKNGHEALLFRAKVIELVAVFQDHMGAIVHEQGEEIGSHCTNTQETDKFEAKTLGAL